MEGGAVSEMVARKIPPEAEAFVEKCLEPFTGDQVGKKPQGTCRDCTRGQCSKHVKQWCETCKQSITTAHIHIDFVGHAHLTHRLLKLDPFWTWEPFALDGDGLPKIKIDGEMAHLWIHLTVGGITRHGVGSEPLKKFNKANENLLKELIGDALRNAAMRFGLALNLWAKGELLEDAEDPPAEGEQGPEKPAEMRPVAKKAATAPQKAAEAPPAKKAAKAQPAAKKAATAPPRPAPAPETNGYPMKDGLVDLPKLFSRIKGDNRQKAMAALADNPIESDEGVVAAWPLPTARTLGEAGEPLSAESLEFVIGEVVSILETWAEEEGVSL